jgi:hypothetical protein
MKRRFLFCLLLLVPGASGGLHAQVVADSNARLTYRHKPPTKAALEIAMAGLATLDGDLISIVRQRGDSVAEITARVRAKTWARNPDVWGGTPPRERDIFMGRMQAYLGGDPRFRIVVKPATCGGCAGYRDIVFLRYKERGFAAPRPAQTPRAP